MKYIDEFRNSNIARKISAAIFNRAKGLKSVNLMEVCGTHTMSVCKFGIRKMLPENINLISGPGCPVCVTPKSYIDRAVALSKLPKTIVATFGDMMKVPGSYSSLVEERSKGNIVKVVYSALDAVEIAEKNPDKKVVFLGIGFETTSPTVAASLVYAKKKNLKNFFVYSGHKIILPAMKALVEESQKILQPFGLQDEPLTSKMSRAHIDGFLCPAHVSTIIGTIPYNIIAKEYNIGCVVTGFEPLDILQGILMIVQQIRAGKPKVENQYKRVARKSGNKRAMRLLDEVFVIKDSEWRGIGKIPKSGMVLKKKYSRFDAEKVFSLPAIKTKHDKGCICGSILKGIKRPVDCRLFAKRCTPENPQGACMVSSEGTCAAYYKYRR